MSVSQTMVGSISSNLHLSSGIDKNYRDDQGRKSLSVTSGAYCSNAGGSLFNVVASGYKATKWDDWGNPTATSASLILASDASAVISGATALDGAAIAVANGAHLYNGYAGSNASVDVVQGGIISGVEVGFSGAAAAAVLTSDADGNQPLGGKNVGGTIFDPLVHSGGYLLAGGGAPSFTVKGFNVAGSGGLVSGGTYEDGSVVALGKGGTSLGGNFAGTQYVQSTGLAVSNIFKGSGATQMVNGGLASRSTALSGAQVLVSGGRGSNIVAGQGGTVLVAGGTYISVLTSDHSTSAGNYSYGSSYGNTVLDGGTEIVGSDGYATSSVVLSGGRELVESGGTTLLTNVSGGSVDVYSGGYMSGGSAAAGGAIAISGGGTGVSVAANSGGSVDIHGHAVASDIIANNSGHVVIEGGAVVSGATANAGGIFDLQSGSVVSGGFWVNGGTADVKGGASVADLTISGGSVELHSGGRLGQFMVSGGTQTPGGPIVQGTLQIDSGAVIDHYRKDGGLHWSGSGFIGHGGYWQASIDTNIDSVVNRDTVSAGPAGVIVIGSGASIAGASAVGVGSSAQQGAAGTMIIHGVVSGAVAQSGGVVSAGSGATVTHLTFSGASAYVGSDAVIGDPGGITHDLHVMNSGAVVSVPDAVLVAEGPDAAHRGYLSVDGGVIDQVQVGSNGRVDITNNGTVGTAFVGQGGQINFSSGAALSLDVTASGVAYLDNGAQVAAGYVAGGTLELKSGGRLDNLNADLGGTTIVNSGGTMGQFTLYNGFGTIQAGATVASVYVGDGGSAVFLSGASALAITVASGGFVSGPFVSDNNSLLVSSGGTAVSAVITAGTHDAKPNPGGGTEHPTLVDNAGGRTTVTSGGLLNSATIAGAGSAGGAGGLLVVESGAVLQNTSMGSNARIRINGLNYDEQHKNIMMQGGTLYVTEGTGAQAQSWSLSLAGHYNPNDFTLVDDGHGNTVLIYACFLAGALIRLEDGDVPVEEVKEGDRLCVLAHGQETVREVVSVIHKQARVRKDLPDDLAGWPVQVCKDAFASGVPSQDLFVTPEHCFYLEGRFVPVRMLVNGTTIRYDLSQESYDYYHVQTEPHSVIWANNTLTESYLETGRRQALQEQQNGAVSRLVDLRERSWVEDAAAPLDVSQAFVEPLYESFCERAQSLGYEAGNSGEGKQDLTEESGLCLMLDDGRMIEKERESHGKVVFALPRRAKTVRLVSRSSRPSCVIGPYIDDRRELGVLVGKIELWVGGREVDVTSHLEGKDLPGWSVIEAGPHRWTTGDGLLPLPDYKVAEGEKVLLTVQIEAGGPYPVASPLFIKNKPLLSA